MSLANIIIFVIGIPSLFALPGLNVLFTIITSSLYIEHFFIYVQEKEQMTEMANFSMRFTPIEITGQEKDIGKNYL